MYQEGKALVKDVAKTVNEVKGIGREVTGIIGWIVNLLAPPKGEAKPATEKVNETRTAKKKAKAEFDETALYSEIGERIIAFFKAYNTLKDHIAEEEEKSRTVVDDSGDAAEKAVKRVLAMSQMEAMQVDLREFMVYHVPPELKDLYTRVNKMLGTIANEQAMARQAAFRRRREIEAARRDAADRRWYTTAYTIAVGFVITYMMGLFWAISRMSNGGTL